MRALVIALSLIVYGNYAHAASNHIVSKGNGQYRLFAKSDKPMYVVLYINKSNYDGCNYKYITTSIKKPTAAPEKTPAASNKQFINIDIGFIGTQMSCRRPYSNQRGSAESTAMRSRPIKLEPINGVILIEMTLTAQSGYKASDFKVKFDDAPESQSILK